MTMCFSCIGRCHLQNNFRTCMRGTLSSVRQEQHTAVIVRKELVERTTADRVTLAPLPDAMPPIPPKTALTIHIQDKNLEGKPLLFHEILDNYTKNNGQLQLLLNWVTAVRLHCSLAKTSKIKRFPGTLLVCEWQCRTGTKTYRKCAFMITQTIGVSKNQAA